MAEWSATRPSQLDGTTRRIGRGSTDGWPKVVGLSRLHRCVPPCLVAVACSYPAWLMCGQIIMIM